MAPRSSQAAVEDGVLKRVSPSQIKEYEQCPRKWYFAKVQGLPVVSRNQKSLDFGSALHKEIENFILEAKPLTSPLAKLGLEYIPTTQGLLVETRVEDPWVAAAGIHVDGYIDLVVPGPVPEIIDWKTTSDIDKWGKTSQELRTDVQMLTYAKWAHAKYDADEVRLSHVQFQTKGRPWVSKKSTVLTLDETNRAWLSVNHQVTQMIADAGKKTPAEVHGNTNSCDNYGGCPFQHVCPSHTRGKDMASLLEKLRGKTADVKPVEAKLANAPGMAPKAEDVLRGPPEDFTPPDMPGEELAVMPSNKPLPDAILKEANKVLDEAYPSDKGFREGIIAAAQKEEKPKGRPKGSKNKPKDVSEPDPKHNEGLRQHLSTEKEDKAEKAQKYPGKDKAASDAFYEAERVSAALSDADLKAVTAAVETQADESNHPEDHTGEGEPLTEKQLAAIGCGSPLRLFINCYPSSPSQDLTQYVNELNIEASNQEKIPDVRLSESRVLGFGKWKGVLAQLAKSRPPVGDCFISTSDLNDPVIEALIPLAALVVRAR